MQICLAEMQSTQIAGMKVVSLLHSQSRLRPSGNLHKEPLVLIVDSAVTSPSTILFLHCHVSLLSVLGSGMNVSIRCYPTQVFTRRKVSASMHILMTSTFLTPDRAVTSTRGQLAATIETRWCDQLQTLTKRCCNVVILMAYHATGPQGFKMICWM